MKPSFESLLQQALEDWPGRTIAFVACEDGTVSCSINGGVSRLGCDAEDALDTALEAEDEE